MVIVQFESKSSRIEMEIAHIQFYFWFQLHKIGIRTVDFGSIPILSISIYIDQIKKKKEDSNYIKLELELSILGQFRFLLFQFQFQFQFRSIK